jgi:hypothetical protein
MRLQEYQLRKIIRETLLLEITPGQIDPGSGGDGTDWATGGAEMDYSAGYAPVPIGEMLTTAAGVWNITGGKFTVKIPGIAGAENYAWSDAAIDIFMLVAGGGIAAGVLKAAKLSDIGAKATRAAHGLYIAVSNKVGHAAAKKLVQKGMTDSAEYAITTPVKKALKQIADSGENIKLELTKQEFEQALVMAKNQGIELMTSDSDIEDLSKKANQAFGITV